MWWLSRRRIRRSTLKWILYSKKWTRKTSISTNSVYKNCPKSPTYSNPTTSSNKSSPTTSSLSSKKSTSTHPPPPYSSNCPSPKRSNPLHKPSSIPSHPLKMPTVSPAKIACKSLIISPYPNYCPVLLEGCWRYLMSTILILRVWMRLWLAGVILWASRFRICCWIRAPRRLFVISSLKMSTFSQKTLIWLFRRQGLPT